MTTNVLNTPTATPSPAGVRRTGGRRRSSGAAWTAVGALAFCFLVDSAYGSLVPMGALLRLGVPLLLVIHMLSAPAVRRTPAERRLANAVAAFAGVGLLSSLLCVAPELGLLKLVIYMGVMAPLLLCRPIADGLLPGTAAFQYFRWLQLGVVAAALAQQRIGFPNLFTNPNAIAGFVVVTTPMLLFGLGSADPRRRRAACLWLAVGALTVLASGSRGGVVGLVMGTLAYFGLRRSGSWVSVLGMGAAVAAVGASLLVVSTATREFAYKDDNALIDDARIASFQEGYDEIKERPLLGYGFGLSWRVERRHVPIALRTGRMSWFVGEFGNTTLAILAGGGILLAIAFVAVIAGVLGPACASLTGSCARGERRDWQLALISGLVAMLIQSQSEAWLMAPMAWGTVAFWTYAGLAVRSATLGGPPRRPPNTLAPPAHAQESS